MQERILGLHHVTAIAGSAQTNLDFYTHTLGLRLVKKTVNFDDPGTYHLYYGDETGRPGTILTFFPWEGIRKGRNGPGMATAISFAVPKGSLPYWKARFEAERTVHGAIRERFGEPFIPFEDPDGLRLELTEPRIADDRNGWAGSQIEQSVRIKGFHSVELTVRALEPTSKILTGIFGYDLAHESSGRFRFTTDAVNTANNIDIVVDPTAQQGQNTAGTNHHVAFRVKDDEVLMKFREKVVSAGFQITEKIDRNYFYSLYFREPNGILFEIASDNPGFTVDEALNELGKNLKLPQQYENSRKKIEEVLPVLKIDHAS